MPELNKLNIKITTEERNKVREKRMKIWHTGDGDRHLEYPMLKLKRVYVDLQIQIDETGRLKGIYLKESNKVIL